MREWLRLYGAKLLSVRPNMDELRTEATWICGYLAVLGMFYLFHAPFRSHVVVRTDWYARLTRITQLWSMVVLFTLHSIPAKTPRTRRAGRPAHGDNEAGTAKLVFFPVFLYMTLLFALLHKLKRPLHMAVTYGSSFSSVILNSLVVAALCTAHYGYTKHIVELVTLSHLWYSTALSSSRQGHFVTALTRAVLPSTISAAPWRTVAQLVTFGVFVIYADYWYKKRWGYDPHAGLLWSDVFEVTKRPASKKSRVTLEGERLDAHRDFRFDERPLVPVETKTNLHAERLDFSLGPHELKQLLGNKYPVNRPAMVSWLTAFAVGTYIQVGLTKLVSLVTSETRSMATREKSKVFDVAFFRPSSSTAAVEPTRNPSMWFDWVADVGDGFNSTYEVARLLAQPQLHFRHTAPSETAKAASATPLADEPVKAADYMLPRGSFVVVGGDLAYPNPTDETYTSRLFEPYRDALPGNPQLRKLFHARQRELVQPDGTDADMAHIQLLDAETVAAMACGADTLRASRGTAEEALHSVPLLFAIPGNHDWFDGLRTFRKYILEKTWIGGWLMPQRSSFFVLRLPYNWFMLCCDTGNEQDIDVAQRNYFLDVIEKYMDAASCVILACHEPGWLQDAWPCTTRPSQPQLARLSQMLGTRLRLRMAGDIHNYSRHMPSTEDSENPVLVTSGGGGAFMHDVMQSQVVAFGERYTRACSFPPCTSFVSFLPRLWGFRVNNWKFDILLGVVCFLFVSPMLLSATLDVERQPATSVLEFGSHCASAAMTLFVSAMTQSFISIAVFLGFLGAFFSSTATGEATVWERLPYSLFWTLSVSAVCYGTLGFLRCAFEYMAQHHLILSTYGKGDSVLERDVLAAVHAGLTVTASWRGPLARASTAALAWLSTPDVHASVAAALRCLDPFEMLRYTADELRANKQAPRAGLTDVLHRRFISGAFYSTYLTFFWMMAVPFVSFIIGCFLMCTTRLFQSIGAYDAAYSSFQIEDYKSFVRFRIDGQTRALHGYTIGVRRVPKLWVRDERCVRHYTEDTDTRPPHLQHFPSRWMPSFPELSRRRSVPSTTRSDSVLPWDKKSQIIDQFTCHPHKECATT